MEAIRGRTVEEWAAIESAEHDELYKDAFPFGLKQFGFTIEHALWYEDYAFKRGRRCDRGYRTRKVFELIDLDALSGKSVLDIGCGIGQYSVLMAKKGAQVVGIDLSEVGIRRAALIADANGVSNNVTFLAGDVTCIAMPDALFDIVLMHEVYHHAIKYPGLKQIIKRVTKPGGRIILADTVRGSMVIDRGRSLAKKVRYWRWPEQYKHEDNLGDVMLTVADYERFADGFENKQIFLMSYFYMVKQTFLKHHVHRFYVRWFLRLTKYMDDFLLALFPKLRKGCGEAILVVRNGEATFPQPEVVDV